MTPRELALAQREAFAHGVKHAVLHAGIGPRLGTVLLLDGEMIDDLAARKYPIRKITRPRVIVDPDGYRWCVRDGQVAIYNSDYLPCVTPYPSRVAMWTDLLANPTEEVEETE